MRQETWGGLTVRITGGTDGDGGGDGPCVVLLHGFGAPGTDLIPLARALEAPEGTRFVFPAAPLSLDMFYGDARAWWMIDMARMEEAIMTGRARDLTDEVPDGLAAAREKMLVVLDEIEGSLGAPGDRTVLGGFSQGAMLSCDLALYTERPLGGLVLLSGTLLAAREWTPRMPKRRGLKVFQSHGRRDPLLPFSVAETLRDRLSEAGLSVCWAEHSGAHEIPPPVLAHLGVFLQTVLAPR